MTLQRQLLFWLGAFVVLALLLYLFREILLPFVAGMAIAYFLDPVADRLERAGFSRLWATVVILLAFILVFVLFIVVLVPVLVQQFGEFAARLPEYSVRLESIAGELVQSDLVKSLGIDFNTGELPAPIRDMFAKSTAWIGSLIASIWSGGMAFISFLALFVVTPVVAFYMLLDWDRMIARVDGWLPRDHLQTVRSIFRDIDTAIAGFVRGQGTVCLLLGLFYAVGLSIVGLNFGLLIGMVAGLISFIPYVGSTIGLVLSVGVALVQFWPEWPWVLVVVGIFALGQFLEGNILSPKLVGERVGLHPVWLMFALFAFAYLFGFVGMLLAVPIAAAIGVLTRFALDQYLQSRLYQGSRTPSLRAPKEPHDIP